MERIPKSRSLIPVEVDGTERNRLPHLYDMVLINKGVGMSKAQEGLLEALFRMSHDDAHEHMVVAHLNQERGSHLLRSSREVIETKVMLANRQRREGIAEHPELAGIAFAMEQVP
jgi:ATP-dependent Clp protease adapter protein ClpS